MKMEVGETPASAARPLPEAAFQALKAKLWRFMESDVYPNEQRFMRESRAIGADPRNEWTHAPVLVELKRNIQEQTLALQEMQRNISPPTTPERDAYAAVT